MWPAFITLLLIITAVLLAGSRNSIRQLKATAGEAYRAGFNAGHVQGWHDAVAAASGQRTPNSGAPAVLDTTLPAPVQPARVGFAGTEFSGTRIGPPAPVVAPSYGSLHKESPAELLARKERRERQNINVTLYVASLLLVAAAALFVGTALPAVLRFAGVCLITALFYGTGLALHAKAPKLRPAAVAFAGTGLALVPVAGLAMYNFAVQDGPLAWLLTSVFGTLAYVVAAVRLESRVLVYLSFTFMVSTAWSGVSLLGASLVWYFAVVIGFAVAMTLVTLAKPGWVAPLFLRPIMVLDPIVVPAVAVAATVLPLRLDRGEFALILALCGAYLGLAAAAPGAGHRLLKIYGARLSLTVAASAWAWHLTGNVTWALFTAGVLLAIQAAAVAATADRLQRWCPAPGGRQHWTLDSFVSLGAQLILILVMLLPASGGREDLLLTSVLASVATGMIIAVAAGETAEWALPAALATGLIAGSTLGPWLVFNILAAATLFWAVRLADPRSPLRPHFILAGRLAGTLAVPALTAAIMDSSDGVLAAAIFAFSLALVLQQLASAAAERMGAMAMVPVPTLAGFTAAGAACLLALSVTDSTAGSLLSTIALPAQLVASLAIGTLLLPKSGPDDDPGTSWRPTVAEALPLGVSAAAVLTAYSGVSRGLANGLLLLVVLYLGSSALRSAAVARRWAYWWMARAAATLLLVMAYVQLQEVSGPLMFAGEELSVATVLIAVLGLQLVFPLVAAVRDRAPDAVVSDVALVLAVQTVTLALSMVIPSAAMEAGPGEWQRTVVVTVMALSAAACGYVFRDLSAAAAFAPSMLAVLLVSSGGRLSDVELLLGIFAVYSAVMVVAADPPLLKGTYFAAARLLTAALAIVLSYDVTTSVTVVSLTFAGVLAFQHVVRWAMRHRLEQVPFQDAAVWVTLGAQALLPALYLVQAGGVSATLPGEGGRGVVLVELLLLLLGALAAHRLFAVGGAIYLCLYAGVFGVVASGPALQFGAGTLLAEPLLSRDGVPLTLLAASLAFNVSGIVRRRRPDGVRVAGADAWFWLAGAVVPSFVAGLTAGQAADWITGATLLVLAATGFTASHVERLPMLYPPAAVLVLAGSTLVTAALFRDAEGVWGAYLPWLAGCGLGGSVLYCGSFVLKTNDGMRQRTLAGAGALGLAAAAIAGTPNDATSQTAAVLVAMTVALVAREVPRGICRLTLEAGAFLVTIAVQRAVLFTDGELHATFWALQWYVLLAAVLAALRYIAGFRTAGRTLLGSGAALLGLSGLGILFGGSGSQQLWVLVLHAALLLAGLLIGERMFVWWGAAGVALCLMWALRSYTFALLALIAVGLIAFALWKLARAKPAAPDGGGPLPERQPAPDGRQDHLY
ncbi:hypothetical protein [Arthrobacter sp. ISL-72]|uniref:hypothetical protein n=1 Tax=Arthrobacter sp. ISL-72 TaxID=2819114 RepID=UPI001BE7E4EF|nr:hypothetical protein [Arthrobacter sp. ISL-72]MBT2594475.1 hypothetical protein [Arthrobacter sp. ISL-72]